MKHHWSLSVARFYDIFSKAAVSTFRVEYFFSPKNFRRWRKIFISPPTAAATLPPIQPPPLPPASFTHPHQFPRAVLQAEKRGSERERERERETRSGGRERERKKQEHLCSGNRSNRAERCFRLKGEKRESSLFLFLFFFPSRHATTFILSLFLLFSHLL